MQTFLPYPNYLKSARCLDNKRLGKQRVECLQIYNALTKNTGWRHHPIVKMWRGHELALVSYGHTVCGEWGRRGYRDNLGAFFLTIILNSAPSHEVGVPYAIPYPPWMGHEAFHASHRSNLLRKDPIWYGQFGWTEPNNLPYVWIR